MILRRLATSIRKQDWFAVVIETLIVVMGVYLGIQLGNWNAERAERVAGRALVERLYEELTISLEYEADCIEGMEANLERVRSVYEMLRTKQLGEGGEAEFRNKFVGFGSWADICIIRSTLDQLQGGQIVLLDDQTLQDQILQFANFLDGNETSVANLGSATMSALQVIFAEVDYAWDEGERRLVTSFDEAAANETLVRQLETVTFMFATIVRYHNMFDEELHDMHAVLAEYLGEDLEAET